MVQEKPKLSPEETKKQIEELRIKNKAKREVTPPAQLAAAARAKTVRFNGPGKMCTECDSSTCSYTFLPQMQHRCLRAC